MKRRARWVAPLAVFVALFVAASVYGAFFFTPKAAEPVARASWCSGSYVAGPPVGDAVRVNARAGSAERVSVTAWTPGGVLLWNASIQTAGEAVWALGKHAGVARVVCQYVPAGGAGEFYVWRGNSTVLVAPSVVELVALAEVEFG